MLNFVCFKRVDVQQSVALHIAVQPAAVIAVYANPIFPDRPPTSSIALHGGGTFAVEGDIEETISALLKANIAENIDLLSELLDEAKAEHTVAEPNLPEHNWPDWYAAYIQARTLLDHDSTTAAVFANSHVRSYEENANG